MGRPLDRWPGRPSRRAPEEGGRSPGGGGRKEQGGGGGGKKSRGRRGCGAKKRSGGGGGSNRLWGPSVCGHTAWSDESPAGFRVMAGSSSGRLRNSPVEYSCVSEPPARRKLRSAAADPSDPRPRPRRGRRQGTTRSVSPFHLRLRIMTAASGTDPRSPITFACSWRVAWHERQGNPRGTLARAGNRRPGRRTAGPDPTSDPRRITLTAPSKPSRPWLAESDRADPDSPLGWR